MIDLSQARLTDAYIASIAGGIKASNYPEALDYLRRVMVAMQDALIKACEEEAERQLLQERDRILSIFKEAYPPIDKWPCWIALKGE